MKVLIIDDSMMIRNMVKKMLENMGYESDSAVNGAEAVRLLEAGHSYDISLLDWNMPELDGPGFLDAVKARGLPAGRIIMMTTENSPEHMQIALAKGASEYIMKPFTDDILQYKIDIVRKAA